MSNSRASLHHIFLVLCDLPPFITTNVNCEEFQTRNHQVDDRLHAIIESLTSIIEQPQRLNTKLNDMDQ